VNAQSGEVTESGSLPAGNGKAVTQIAPIASAVDATSGRAVVMILRGAAAEENANVSLLPSTEFAAAAFAAAAAARHEGLYTHVVDRAQGTLTGV
jgi:hypothetical protein